MDLKDFCFDAENQERRHEAKDEHEPGDFDSVKVTSQNELYWILKTLLWLLLFWKPTFRENKEKASFGVKCTLLFDTNAPKCFIFGAALDSFRRWFLTENIRKELWGISRVFIFNFDKKQIYVKSSETDKKRGFF